MPCSQCTTNPLDSGPSTASPANFGRRGLHDDCTLPHHAAMRSDTPSEVSPGEMFDAPPASLRRRQREAGRADPVGPVVETLRQQW
mmetsp:Transcript_67829/g.180514  ORF Transcript_67829/g.180514 Transcript_67829/m.180514 type:complete len:86 (+) Transcript_67829:1043-1300(+)